MTYVIGNLGKRFIRSNELIGKPTVGADGFGSRERTGGQEGKGRDGSSERNHFVDVV